MSAQHTPIRTADEPPEARGTEPGALAQARTMAELGAPRRREGARF